MKNWTYESLKEQGLILFECISGSKAYGTDTPESDTDIRFVYILPLEDILGLGYVEQVNNPTNDITGWEIRRFMELLASGNPTVIEILAMPEDVTLFKHPVFDLLLNEADLFITKKLKNSMGGYARQQIQKATGQDKMMNWEKEKMERKGPLDFCYVTRKKGGSLPLLEWLERVASDCKIDGFGDITQENLGAVPVPHMRDMYDLYIDIGGGFARGLVGEDGKSNDLRVASVPVGLQPAATLYYNKDGYSMHCKLYKQYQEWLEKRNDARWVDSQNHGQKIDGKNMLHCVRLLQMSREIASGQGVIVRRPNREELLNIRRGNGVVLADLVKWASEEIKVVDDLFDKSAIPDDVPDEVRDRLLRDIRRRFYIGQGTVIL